MGVKSFETAQMNLVSSRTILYVAITTKGGSKSKIDLHWNESSCKGLSNDPGTTYFPVLIVEIFKVEIGETVKKELQRIYKERGELEHLQSDNEGEFKRQVKYYCKIRKIKMINYRPYNPKAQGKVRRSHRSLR